TALRFSALKTAGLMMAVSSGSPATAGTTGPEKTAASVSTTSPSSTPLASPSPPHWHWFLRALFRFWLAAGGERVRTGSGPMAPLFFRFHDLAGLRYTAFFNSRRGVHIGGGRTCRSVDWLGRARGDLP